jgi:ABC-type phosphate/phosphonate transport system substrate-binding protein
MKCEVNGSVTRMACFVQFANDRRTVSIQSVDQKGGTMIACLPMYDRPELRHATDALWNAIALHLREKGIDAPAKLTRSDDYPALWQRPDLLLGMACGKPYRTDLHRHAHLLGNFDYGLPGCSPGHYQSHVIARRTDPRQNLAEFTTATFAFNDPNSESGFCCIDRWLGGVGAFFDQICQSGSHQSSIMMVSDKRADCAAIDAVTWRYATQSHPDIVAGIKVIGSTEPVAGLPLITNQAELTVPIRSAIKAALMQDVAACKILQIRGVVFIEHETFMSLRPFDHDVE